MFNARDRHNFSPGLSSWSTRDELPRHHDRGGYHDFANMSVAQFEEFKRRQMFRECYEEADDFQQGRERAQSQGPATAPFRPLSQIMREDLEDHGYATDHQPRSRSSNRGRLGWRDEFDDVGYATDAPSRRVPRSRSRLTESPTRTQQDARSSQDTSDTSSQDDTSEASPRSACASKSVQRKKASPSATKAKGTGGRKRRAKSPVSQIDTQAPQLTEALRMQAQKIKKRHDARNLQCDKFDDAVDGGLRHSVTQRSPPPHASSRYRRSDSSYPEDLTSGSDRDLHQTSSSECPTLYPSSHHNTSMPPIAPLLLATNSFGASSHRSRHKNRTNARIAGQFGVKKELGGSGGQGRGSTFTPSLGPQIASNTSIQGGASTSPARRFLPDNAQGLRTFASSSSSPAPGAITEEQQSSPTPKDAYTAPYKPLIIAQGIASGILPTEASTVDASRGESGVGSTKMVRQSVHEITDRVLEAQLYAQWSDLNYYEEEREKRGQQADELRRNDQDDLERRKAERRAERKRQRAKDEEKERRRAEREAQEHRKARIEMQKFLTEQARAQQDQRRAEKERRKQKDQAQQAFTRATQARRNSNFEVPTPQHVSPPPRAHIRSSEPIPISSDESSSDDDTEDTLTEETRLENGTHSPSSQKSTNTDVEMVDINVPKGILKRPREDLTEPTPLPRKKVRIATPDHRKSPIAASQVQIAAPPTPKPRPQLGGTLRLNNNGTGVAGTTEISETSAVFSRSDLGERLVNNLFDKGELRPKACSTPKLSQKQETIRNPLIVASQDQQASGQANNESEDEEIKAARAKINEAQAKKRWEKKAAEKRAKGEDPGVFVYKPSKRSKKRSQDHDAAGDTAQPSNKEKTPKKTKPKKSAIMQKIKKGVHQAAIDRNALYSHAQSFHSSESSNSEVASDSGSNIETTEQNISQQTPENTNLHTDAEILKHVHKVGNDEESLFVKDEPDPDPSYHNPDQHTQVAPADPSPTSASTPKLVHDDGFVDMQDFYAAEFGVDGSLPAESAHEAMPAEAATDEFDDLFNDPEPVTVIQDIRPTALEPVRKRPGVNKKPAQAGNHVRAPAPAAPTHLVNMASHIDTPSRSQDTLPSASSKSKSTKTSAQMLGKSIVLPTTIPTSQSTTRRPENRGFLRQLDLQQPTISRQKRPAPDVIDFDEPEFETPTAMSSSTASEMIPRIPTAAQNLLGKFNQSSKIDVTKLSHIESTASPVVQQPQASQASLTTQSSNDRRSNEETFMGGEAREELEMNSDAMDSRIVSPSFSSSHDHSPASTAQAKKSSKSTNTRDGKPLPTLGRFKTNSLKHWAWVEAKTFLETGHAAPGDLNFFRKNQNTLDDLLEQKQSEADAKNAAKAETASREIALMKSRPRERSIDEVIRRLGVTREEDCATSVSTNSTFEEDLDSPSTIRSFMSQNSSSATSVDGGYILPDGRPHTAESHPRFAGKQLNHPEVRKYFNVQERYDTDLPETASDADAEEFAGQDAHGSTVLPNDEPCYVYLVNRKQWRAHENEDEVPWLLGSKPIHYTKDAANTAANAEKMILRDGMADNPLERIFDTSKTDNGLFRWFCELRTGFIRIEVEQRMLERGDKLLPKKRQSFLPSRVWLIKREIFICHPRQHRSLAERVVQSRGEEQETMVSLGGDEEEANSDDELERQLARAMIEASEDSGLIKDPSGFDANDNGGGVGGQTKGHVNDDDQRELASEGIETYDGTHTELWRANRDACDWILQTIFDESQSQRMDYVFKSNTISDIRNEANARREGLNMEEQFVLKEDGVETSKMVRVWVEAMRVIGPKNA